MGFEIVDIIDSGTYGTVCVAVDSRRVGEHDSLVALKILKEDLTDDENYINRLRDEGKLLRMLDHPNIVKVFELSEVDDRPVVVMEFLRGVSLIDLLEISPSGLPGAVALEITRQAANALDAAWSGDGPDGPLRVIHRDVKPANLLVTVDGVVKLVDFGLARAEFRDREAKTSTRVLGTHGFVAPERIRGEPDTPAGDVYALGVVLYELLTGEILEMGDNTGNHQVSVRRALEQLQAAGLEARQVVEVAGLLGEMCAYHAKDRPTAGEVERTIGSLGLDVDLLGYARSHVVPLMASRVPRSVRGHAAFGDVAALTQDSGLAEPEERLRAVLADPRWPERRSSLGELLDEDFQVTPFLEVLERGRAAWWKVWVRPPRPEELVAALEILEGRPGVWLASHARDLVHHKDPSVAQVAARILEAEGGTVPPTLSRSNER